MVSVHFIFSSVNTDIQQPLSYIDIMKFPVTASSGGMLKLMPSTNCMSVFEPVWNWNHLKCYDTSFFVWKVQLKCSNMWRKKKLPWLEDTALIWYRAASIWRVRARTGYTSSLYRSSILVDDQEAIIFHRLAYIGSCSATCWASSFCTFLGSIFFLLFVHIQDFTFFCWSHDFHSIVSWGSNHIRQYSCVRHISIEFGCGRDCLLNSILSLPKLNEFAIVVWYSTYMIRAHSLPKSEWIWEWCLRALIDCNTFGIKGNNTTN